MDGPFRLSHGGAIDRQRVLHFTFDGRPLTGYEGDTLASALLGAGVRIVGRSFKFHRPRGVLSAGIEEPNALVTIGEGANKVLSVRATRQPLYEGLAASSQNCWPALSFDIGRVNDFLHRLLPAGFYNKTFIWPRWHTYEPVIRRAAGLGVTPSGADPDRYEWRNAHCDVLVVGGGAAGLQAASLAGRSGARVILIESDTRLGGGLIWSRDPSPEPDDVARQLGGLANVRILLRTTAVSAYDHELVAAVETVNSPPGSTLRERWWRIRAKQIVLATGAIEQPLAFPYNDRPGIVLADAARHYQNRYAVSVGRRIAVVTNNDSGYQVARDLRAADIDVPCLLDTRQTPPTTLVNAISSLGVKVHTDARVLRTNGAPCVRELEAHAGRTTPPDSTFRIPCDAIAMSGGWSPVAHLYCQAQGRLRFDSRNECYVPDGELETLHAVGAAAGCFDMNTALKQTITTLQRVLERLGFNCSGEPLWNDIADDGERAATDAPGYSGDNLRDRTWLDFQHDATVSDVDLAVRENLISVEHVKRYTTIGMSVDQGKTSNLNALGVMADRLQRPLASFGTTTFRPFFTPVTLGAIAGGRNGRFYRSRRLLPAHDEHAQLGAVFEDYGSWQRPTCYCRPGESISAAIEREVRAVRSHVGLFDASPLGKFLVRGPDAAEFLDRMYANTMRTLAPGKVRYGLMLNEKGVVIDDGVCARLSPGEFWVNTTGSGAARISAWLEEWLQGEWPALNACVTDVTAGWATLNLAGARAREVLARLPGSFDFSREAFPHMHARTGTLCGVPCRILRVSFSGELSYEISVPADYGAALWAHLHRAGQPFGITSFGVEALLMMRAEKGYPHVGVDTDGTTTPGDIGFGAAVAAKRGDFIGRRSLSLAENLRDDRLQLVGIRCEGSPQAFIPGAHLLDAAATQLPHASSGYLTTAIRSATLNQHIGLGLLKNGRARIGASIYVFDDGKHSCATVVDPTHYDPTGERLNG